jgi:hypothetical protein
LETFSRKAERGGGDSIKLAVCDVGCAHARRMRIVSRGGLVLNRQAVATTVCFSVSENKWFCTTLLIGPVMLCRQDSNMPAVGPVFDSEPLIGLFIYSFAVCSRAHEACNVAIEVSHKGQGGNVHDL